MLGGDAVIGEHPALHRAVVVVTAHPVLLPGQANRGAVDGEIDVGHERSVLDQGARGTPGSRHLAQHLLDAEGDLGAAALVGQHPHVF